MVRIRFGAGGICGSDMHYFRHARTGDFVVTSPLVLGHEVAGEIVELGSGVTGLSVGDHVAVNPSRWCGQCTRCREGRENLREHLLHGVGVQDAAHAGRLRQPVRRDRSPVHQGAQRAVMVGGGTGRTAGGLPARGRAGAMEDRKAIVFGAGPIGLLTMLAARWPVPWKWRSSMSPKRRSPSRTLGADTVDISGGDEPLPLAAERGYTSLSRFPDRRWSGFGHRHRPARRYRGPDRQSARRRHAGARQRRHGEGTGPQGHLPLRPGV